MRKGLRVCVALLALSLVVAACSKSNTNTTSTSGKPAVKVAMLYDIGGRGDKSFNDSAAAGLDKARTDFHIQTKELSPNSGGTNRLELLNLVASQGYQLVITVGFLYAPTTCTAANKFPNVKFGDVDGFIDHTTTPCPGAHDLTSSDNVTSLLFTENEGAYLVGAAAALKSKTHHIGFIGGVDIALIQKFQAGFDAGATKIDPTITIDHKYLTEPPNFAGFNDPAAAQQVATSMYQGGADVVYHAAGGSGAGLFKAAVQYSTANNTHVWAIGTDSDQYLSAPPDEQPYILTSNLKRVDVAVYDTIRNFVDGKFTGGVQTFDLKAGGVGYATSGGFVDDIKTQLDQLAAEIKSGQIVVPTTLSG
ncbi:MAG TPA: BMP family ABC transporter substrate-binding protein [Actinomycetota bacterium]|nr:BMP family ABC transporter substrate-binding protein [Actinomycetota bacterium]